MLFNLPQDYIVSKYLQFTGFAKYKRLSNVYEGCCPICREGNSWGKKKRSFYIVKKNIICCHNCGWYSSPYNWIKKVCGLNDIEIINEVKTFDPTFNKNIKADEVETKKIIIEALPENSINLFDKNQIDYYKDNKIVNIALETIKNRRLNSCINKPAALFLSLTDKVHKNRLILPFYYKNKIVFYQSRTLLESDNKTKPKYLSKISGEKTLFNFDKISNDLEYIFLFEGPIDSCFVQNGLGLTGIQEKSKKTFTQFQHNQLNELSLFNRVFVLDSQWQDTASLRKSKALLDQGESVFIWPEKLGRKFKDFNDICIALKRDYIKPEFILENTSTGLKGIIELSKISKYKN